MARPKVSRQEEGFLAAIAAEPDDDALRLVYADWLEDHDDPRGTFIRAQVELARTGEADPAYPALLARSRRCGGFTAPRERPSVDHVPGGHVMFRRGLIANVWTDADKLLALPARQRRLAPIEQLTLSLGNRTGAALAACPDLGRVRTLCLIGSWPTHELADLLGESSHLAGLRNLVLQECHLPDAQLPLPQLASSLRLPALESLRWGTFTRADDWRALVPGITRPLSRLILHSYTEDEETDLEDPPEWSWLQSTHHWPQLRCADLLHHVNSTHSGHYCRTPLCPVTAVLKQGQMQSLRLSLEDLPRLLACRRWGPLRKLTLACRNVVAELAGLAQTRLAQQMTELHLCDPLDPYSEERVQPDALAQGPYLTNLRRLSVGCEEGTDVPHLVAGPYRASLLRLELSGLVGLVGVTSLAETALPCLHSLQLNDVHELEDLKPLLQTQNFPNLATLILPKLTWGRRTALEKLISKLATAPGLPHLSLVAAGWRHYWILGGGQAQLVAPGILPDWCDWAEEGPYRDW